jgi:hypothetical protein
MSLLSWLRDRWNAPEREIQRMSQCIPWSPREAPKEPWIPRRKQSVNSRWTRVEGAEDLAEQWKRHR